MPVEQIGGHCPTIQQFPAKLKKHGTNAYAEPMFRVIWSESRYYLVGAAHREYNGDPSDDATLELRKKDPNLNREFKGYKWLPLYPGPGRWILEMWKSSFAFTGCSKEQWEILYRDPATNLLTLGPYPERGEYCQCSVNLSRQPTISEIDRNIYFIKAGWNYSYNEKAAANREALEKSEKDRLNSFKDMFHDAQQAFNNNPSSVRPGKKTAEKIEFRYSAEELRLRRSQGFNSGSPRGPAQRRTTNARYHRTTRTSRQRA